MCNNDAKLTGEYLFFVTLFVFLLFSLKDGLILFLVKGSHLYGFLNVDYTTFEESYLYLPFLNRFSLFNLLPAAPIVSLSFSAYTLFPPLTLLLAGFFYKIICFSAGDIFLFICHTVFPTLSFLLIFLTYRKYLSNSWALLLAFFGVTFYSDFSSLHYIINLFFHPGLIISSASLKPLELSRFPFPDISFLYFIICFYLSIRNYKISLMKCVLLSALWALNIYIYQYNFFAGMLFWFPYMFFVSYLNRRAFFSLQLVKLLIIACFVILLVTIPFLYNILPIYQDILLIIGNVGIYPTIVINEWGAVFSYLIPVMFTILVITVCCADYYELFYKFTPIFIMIGVEIFILNFQFITGIELQPQLFSIRVGNFFSRYLYFIPVIYFLSSPPKQLTRYMAKTLIVYKLRDWFYNYIHKNRRFFVVVGIVLISIVVIFSSIKNYLNYRNNASQYMSVIESQIRVLSLVKEKNGVVAFEYIPSNLAVPAIYNFATLLPSSFNNLISKDEILNRIILFAKLFQWNKMVFLKFMMPNVGFEQLELDNNSIITEENLKNGFGYWLLWHKRKLTPQEMEKYKKDILNKFESANVLKLANVYDLSYVISNVGVNAILKQRQVTNSLGINLYKIEK